MASTVTKPPQAGGRADDYRAFKFRVRRLTPVGNYATNGEVITARQLGLKRIIAVQLLNGSVAAASTPTTAEAVGFVVAADGLSATMRFYESGAANAALAEKTNAEAPPTGQVVDILAIGY